MSAEGTPIFVDDTGRRRALTRRAGRIAVIGFGAYLGLVVIGFARDPRVGPISLPSFGLPSLGLVTPPALSVLGAQESRTAADGEAGSGEKKARSGGPTTSTSAVRGLPPFSTSTTAGGAAATPATVGRPTTTTTAGRPAPKAGTDPAGSTTTTSPTPSEEPGTTTTSTTTAPTTTTSRPGQGHDTAAASGKGPDSGGPPGQLRKATTPTTVG